MFDNKAHHKELEAAMMAVPQRRALLMLMGMKDSQPNVANIQCWGDRL